MSNSTANTALVSSPAGAAKLAAAYYVRLACLVDSTALADVRQTTRRLVDKVDGLGIGKTDFATMKRAVIDCHE